MNCISAKSATQILSLKDEYTLRFLTFLITDFWISSSRWLFSELIPARDTSNIFWNALLIVMSSLSFKWINHAYLLRTSVTNQALLLYLLINCIFVKSANQILSL